MIVIDKFGAVLAESHPGSERDFSDQVLRDAQLAGLDLEGFCFDSADLSGADFAGADLYWANLINARCDDCSFVDADLRGASLFRTSLRRADFRRARLCLDNLLGSTDISGIDFTDALLEGADFTGATYDTNTKFPMDFDPLQRGLRPKQEAEL